MSEVRDELERTLGARLVGTLAFGGENAERKMPLALPGSEEEVVELLRLASARRWSVLPVGAGTKLAWGPPPARTKFALSTRGLTGIVAFERGDGTLTARAGSTMSALAQIARSAGNRLTPDVAHAEASTLGGVLGAGASGIDRSRFGPVRHHVLGMRVALADGTLANCGGRLVKNVTGYDLHRLYTGSRGSLCVILEASLRLFSAAEREVVLAARFFGRELALDAADRVMQSGVKPVAVVVETITRPDQFTLHVALAGLADVVVWEQEVVTSALREVEIEPGDALTRLRDLEPEAHLRVATMPSELPKLLATIDDASATKQLVAHLVIQPGIASVDVALRRVNASLPEGPSDADNTSDVLHLARMLSARGFEVSPRAASPEVAAAIDPLAGVPGAARALMRRLKTKLDPQSIFSGNALGHAPTTVGTAAETA